MQIPKTANKILDRDKIRWKLERMAFQAMELAYGDKEIVLIGIEEGGHILARSLGDTILQNDPQKEVRVTSLYINKKDPLSDDIRLGTNIDLNGKVVIVVDDVGNTGKTLFYALKPVIATRPAKLFIAVLVERMHKVFPVKADIVGFPIASTYNEHIIVKFTNNEAEGAYLF
jgi:pyrimidine operon attenuation protein / uracil phosphoribosyltransferase